MPKEKTIKVKAIENLSTFMAVDGKLYKLKKGDIVSLPKTNADMLLTHGVAVLSKGKVTAKSYTPPTLKPEKENEYKFTQREKWLLEGKYKILGTPKKVKKLKIPAGLTLQEELAMQGGQMHFRTDNKKPKGLSAKKTNKRVKKGSNSLMTFGVKLSNVKTLEDMF